MCDFGAGNGILGAGVQGAGMIHLDDLVLVDGPVLAFDPGSERVGIAFIQRLVDGFQVVADTLPPNMALLYTPVGMRSESRYGLSVVIETPRAYTERATQALLDTCILAGRLAERWLPRTVVMLSRSTILRGLTGETHATNSEVRQAIIGMFGGKEVAVGRKGTKKQPGTLGPLYDVHGQDAWDALAAALAYAGRAAGGIADRCKPVQ